jgi:putative SOS response-associated peptidase YedK
LSSVSRERWKESASDELVKTFAIITTRSNALCGPVRNRMLAVIEPDNYALAGEVPATGEELRKLRRSFPAERTEAHMTGRGLAT